MSIRTALDNARGKIATIYDTLESKRCTMPSVEDLAHVLETIQQLPNKGYTLSVSINGSCNGEPYIGVELTANGIPFSEVIHYKAGNNKLTNYMELVFPNIDLFYAENRANAFLGMTFNGQTYNGDITQLTSDSRLVINYK